MAQGHGGDIVSFVEKYGREPVDFSSNINPLGMPEKVKAAATRGLDKVEEYPDPACRLLTEKLADVENLPAQWILCGNGAADIIFRLVRAVQPGKALVLAPAFAEYETALLASSCKVEHYLLKEENGFQLDRDILKEILPGLDMLFLCEPNNPTGCVSRPELLQEILQACKQTGTLLVVDECFNEFLDQPEKHSLKKQIFAYENLFLLKAFTKIYAMPGLRLGYGVSANQKILNRMREVGQPWAVSCVAQAAGVAALDEKEFLQKTIPYIQKQREFLKEVLLAKGVKIYGSCGNYIFFKTTVPYFGEKMAQQGILVRDCGNYTGLEAGYYRIAVRTQEENHLFAEKLNKI